MGKETRYFQWLLKSKSKQESLKNHLVDVGADVYDGKGLIRGEVIKFRIGGFTCILWETGYASKDFIRIVKSLKRSCK